MSELLNPCTVRLRILREDLKLPADAPPLRVLRAFGRKHGMSCAAYKHVRRLYKRRVVLPREVTVFCNEKLKEEQKKYQNGHAENQGGD